MPRILVPPSRAAEARSLLDAGFDDPADEFGDATEAGLQELLYDRPLYQVLHWGLRLWVLYAVVSLVLVAW